jgi:hypothetical protein
VIAASVSKYRQYPVGLFSRKFLTTAREKKVLPVELSPAIAVILFLDTPPKIDPDTRALKMYEPVSTYVSVSSIEDAICVYSPPISFTISFKNSISFYT